MEIFTIGAVLLLFVSLAIGFCWPKRNDEEKRSQFDPTLNVGMSAMYFTEYQRNGGEINLPPNYGYY